MILDISQIQTAKRKAFFVTVRFDTSGQCLGSLRQKERRVEEVCKEGPKIGLEGPLAPGQN